MRGFAAARLQSPKSVVLHCCRVIQMSGSFGAFGPHVWKKRPVLLETSNRCYGRGRGRIALNVSQAVCIGVVSITRLKPGNQQKQDEKSTQAICMAGVSDGYVSVYIVSVPAKFH